MVGRVAALPGACARTLARPLPLDRPSAIRPWVAGKTPAHSRKIGRFLKAAGGRPVSLSLSRGYGGPRFEVPSFVRPGRYSVRPEVATSRCCWRGSRPRFLARDPRPAGAALCAASRGASVHRHGRRFSESVPLPRKLLPCLVLDGPCRGIGNAQRVPRPGRLRAPAGKSSSERRPGHLISGPAKSPVRSALRPRQAEPGKSRCFTQSGRSSPPRGQAPSRAGRQGRLLAVSPHRGSRQKFLRNARGPQGFRHRRFRRAFCRSASLHAQVSALASSPRPDRKRLVPVTLEKILGADFPATP